MHIKIIPFGSAQYEETKSFRERVLRAPLGLRLTEEDIAGEDQQIHIAAVDEANAVVATVLLKPLAEDVLKLRQLAVSDHMQGTGLGKKMILFAEQIAKKKNAKKIDMHARLSALGFYQKLGYAAEGDEFTETTLPHVRMTKSL